MTTTLWGKFAYLHDKVSNVWKTNIFPWLFLSVNFSWRKMAVVVIILVVIVWTNCYKWCWWVFLLLVLVVRIGCDSWQVRGGSRGRVQGVCTPPEIKFRIYVFTFKNFLAHCQWRHSLEVHPLLRKILDPPLQGDKWNLRFLSFSPVFTCRTKSDQGNERDK